MPILTGGRQPYAQDVLPHYLREENPDILWLLLDTFMLFPWVFQHNFAPATSIMYYPSDGEYFPKGCENVLRKFDHTVAMSMFAQQQVSSLFDIRSDYIPHATHPDIFKPFNEEEKKRCKAKFGIPNDAFVFGDVSRNQGRKMMGYEILAFAEFLKNNPKADAYLLLHTDFNDVAAHTDLINLSKRCNVIDRIKPTGMSFHKGFPLSTMVEVYNAMDVRMSSSTGEGFGICSIESMSCEIPNINVDYTTTPELYGYPLPPIEDGHFRFVDRKEIQMGECGIGVPIATEVPGTWDVYRGFVDHFKFADAMEALYNSPKIRKKMGQNGRKRVKKFYSWDGPHGVARQWMDYFDKVVA